MTSVANEELQKVGKNAIFFPKHVDCVMYYIIKAMSTAA